jgi:lysozyme family protein
MPSLRFQKFIKQVLANEGGYVNDPADPGGETKFGITKKSYPTLDIKQLTEQQASNIYYLDYWNPLYDLIESNKLSYRLFDVGINIGKKKAVEILQTLLVEHGAQITVDGKFGQKTLDACNANSVLIYPLYVKKLEEYYKGLTIKNPNLTKFLNGWLKRLNKMVI